MIYRNLGKTQAIISAIGQGSIGAGSRTNTSPEKIQRRIEVFLSGIKEGITFLDTGEDYEDGHAEEVLGKAIKGLRNRVFISGKFKPVNNTFLEVLRSAEMSLKRLNIDYFDLYQIQWPNPQVPLSETLGAMLKLVDQGKVRFLGVSNFTCSQLKEAVELSADKIVSIQTEYNLLNREVEKDILPYCQSLGLSLIAYSPLSRWNMSLKDNEKITLERICTKYAVTMPQIFLNWLISRKNIVALTQTMSIEHVKENARSVNFKLSSAEIEELNKVFLRQPVFIPTKSIRVLNYDVDETHHIYLNLEDALKNKLNIQPSPVVIADELKQGLMLRPVELVVSKDKTGSYEYDLTHGRMRYWAWIIAYGEKKPIPAYIINDKG